jgi:hypothetical protein
MNVLGDEQRDALARACATLRKQASGSTRAQSAMASLSDTVTGILEHGG